MIKPFTLIAMGYSFALMGLVNIYISLARHIPIFEPLQWFCLTCFVGFNIVALSEVFIEHWRRRS